ncbi:MAG TPA: DHA2 family efflux MFS transporter permease subunit [Methanocorpusculum sp.]|nr:DHA2 family efflux MFS transporter permease subunit [Methanocorpusculum sp.]
MENSLPSGKALILILIAASLSSFMSSLDGTIVNIALPSIAEGFNLTTSSVAWVSTIYFLVIAGSLLIVGKLTDLLGLRKMFITGFTIFVIGSFSCGFFPELLDSFKILILARIVQALGGVLMMVVAPAMLSAFMPGARRAKGMSLVVLFAAVGMALGPTLGGFLTEYLSWNWIFYINIPVGIIGIILGFFVIPCNEPNPDALKGFDTSGAVLVFVGLAALLFAFSEGFSMGWTSLPLIISIILAVLCLGGFVWREHHYDKPLIDFGLFKSRSFIILNIILALLYFTFAGANYMLPFYLEYVQGLTTSGAGLILTSLSLGMMITGVISGFIYAKLIGKIRYLIMSGVVLIGVGYFFLSHLSPVTGIGVIIIALTLIGFGLGLTTVPLSTLIMGMVPAFKQGMVSSITSLERYAPMTIGVAVYNLILIVGIVTITKHSGITEIPASDIAAKILSLGFDLAFMVSVILAIVVLILCFFIKEEREPVK